MIRKILKKENMMRRINRAVSLLLASCLLVNGITMHDVPDLKKRNINLSDYAMSSRYAGGFEKKSSFYDERNEIVKFTASNPYSSYDETLFDKVSLEDNYDEESEKVTITNEDVEGLDDASYDLESLEENMQHETIQEEDMLDDNMSGDDEIDDEYDDMDIVSPDDVSDENLEVEYECTFDMNELMFHFKAELIAEDEEILDEKEIDTKAIVTQNGGLDALINIDGELYRLSDYEDKSSIDECATGFVIPDIIKMHLTAAEVAEQAKARSNFKYNKNLEKKGNGVKRNRYVFNQTDTTTQDRKAGNYRFGFTSFSGVGCEVAAAYNCSISLGDKDWKLSDTICFFEVAFIEFSIAWGNFGSNPLEIYRYLNKRGYHYSKYTNFNKLSSAVSKKNECRIIMSRWNKKPLKYGLHTFYIKKAPNGSFYGYNWETKNGRSRKNFLSTFNDGSGFIVGYIVWK